MFIWANAIAQNSTIDSLESIVNSKESKEAKSEVFKALAIELIFINLNKSFNYANLAINNCQSRNCQLTTITQICRKYRGLGKDSISQKLFALTNPQYLLEEDSMSAQWYYTMGVSLDKLGENDSASIVLHKSLEISEEINYQDKMAEAYNVLGH